MKNEKIDRYFKKVKKENLSDIVASRIQNLIFSQKLKIGDKLPSERELTKLFGVSRVVIRESLISLEKSGLIETIKEPEKSGTYVVFDLYKPFLNSLNMLFQEGELSLEDFSDVRLAVECLSVKIATIKSNKKDILKLKQINDELLDDNINRLRVSQINDNFHVTIAEISRNIMIKIIVTSSIELINSLFTADYEVSVLKETLYKRHRAIIDAMASKDIESSEKCMAKDVEFTKRLVPYHRN